MIDVFIADDHAMIREGLKSIISKDKDIAVVGEAADGNETLRKIREYKIDVLLLDISMPGPGFLELLNRIEKMQQPSKPRKVLILTANSEDQYAFRALKAGADGFLTKENSPEELIRAIHKLHKGGKYVSQYLAENIVDLVIDKDKTVNDLHYQLSDREYQIFCMLGKGISVKDISTTLSLSSKTISTYRSRLLKKMGLKTNADIIRYVIENKLE